MNFRERVEKLFGRNQGRSPLLGADRERAVAARVATAPVPKQSEHEGLAERMEAKYEAQRTAGSHAVGPEA
jgi:hypothetical protein